MLNYEGKRDVGLPWQERYLRLGLDTAFQTWRFLSPITAFNSNLSLSLSLLFLYCSIAASHSLIVCLEYPKLGNWEGWAWAVWAHPLTSFDNASLIHCTVLFRAREDGRDHTFDGTRPKGTCRSSATTCSPFEARSSIRERRHGQEWHAANGGVTTPSAKHREETHLTVSRRVSPFPKHLWNSKF